MAKITKALLYAEQVIDEIVAPGPGGDDLIIARPGMWVTYKEKDGEFEFVGFLTDDEFHDKWKRVG